MNYFVTGASGFLGSNLINFMNEDSQITILALQNEDISHLKLRPNMKIVRGNVLDYKCMLENIKEDDVVIHMAGIIDISTDDKSMLYNVNVQGTKNVADACLTNKAKKLIYISSVHAFVPKKNKELMDETSSINPEQVVGDYSKSKALATNYIHSLKDKGLNVSVVYPSGIIGPNDEKVSNTSHLILDIANKKIKARVNGAYDFVDVRDVAKGIIEIAKLKDDEDFILSGEKITIDEIFQVIDSFLGRNKKTPKIATWFVKMFASLAELYYKVRKQKPLFTKHSLYTITSNCNFTHSKATNAFGYNPIPIKQSILQTLIWYFENKPNLLENDVLSIIKQIKKENFYQV